MRKAIDLLDLAHERYPIPSDARVGPEAVTVPSHALDLEPETGALRLSLYIAEKNQFEGWVLEDADLDLSPAEILRAVRGAPVALRNRMSRGPHAGSPVSSAPVRALKGKPASRSAELASPRGYRVIGHARGNECPRCHAAAFCDDCGLCERCRFSLPDVELPQPPAPARKTNGCATCGEKSVHARTCPVTVQAAAN